VIRILQSKDIGRLLSPKAVRLADAEGVVRPILEAVRKRGDRALLEYARKFDGFSRKSVRVPESELRAACSRLAPEFRGAVETAAANIRAYAERQMPREWTVEEQPGMRLGQIVRPLDTVAAYIPSGRYPLPSTILMTVVPAQVAGVPNICVASPRPVAEVFGTAALLGVGRVFEMGGAQAIAAFAFGTRTVPRADRIVGPGNIYVAAAKKLLAGEVGIDFVAGPTEILIVAAEGDPRWLAADMLAQAEHDVDASAVLLTTSKKLAAAVAKEVDRQLGDLPTAAVARKAIARNSAVVLVGSLDEAMEMANRFAPEHLSIPDARLLANVKHAGSVFVGPHSPEAAGDYASGPNHVLPTGGAARIRGGLAVTDYLKVISVQELSEEALGRLGPTITTLARAEGLEAHARSVEVRVGVASKQVSEANPRVRGGPPRPSASTTTNPDRQNLGKKRPQAGVTPHAAGGTAFPTTGTEAHTHSVELRVGARARKERPQAGEAGGTARPTT
jgi:histidinol dehydrogenase